MTYDDEQKPVENPDDTDAFLRTARERYSDAADAERNVRQEAHKDLQYRAGEQWSSQAREIRENNMRPCLTINRIPQFIHQISNELRKNAPALSVEPQGDGAERDAADIWQGLIRHIEVRSDAKAAYQTAFDNAVGNSFGWWRVLTEYAGPDTFDQEIIIKPIRDAFSVFVDPGAIEPDRSDMNYAFVRTSMTREEFKRQWPKSKISEFYFHDSNFGDIPGQDWLDANSVQIAEYWLREYKDRTLQLLVTTPDKASELREIFGDKQFVSVTKDGRATLTVFEDQYKGIPLPPGIGIKSSRPVKFPTVKWFKITGCDVLEKTDWPGMYIPLIPVFGEEVVLNGSLQVFSLTRFIRDSQALYNYFRSQQAEIIALTPRAPWVGPVGSFKSHQKVWQTANNVNFPYMEYDIVTGPNGQPGPAPQRNVAEPPIAAVNQAVLQANDDLKAGTGIYDSSLGARGNETSGRAIIARQDESDTANFHFIENFRRSMRHQGRILLDLIPHIYDRAERIVRIVKPNNDHEMVMINGPTEYNGKPAFFDPSVGRYDIVVDVGPSYHTKQAQVFEMLSEFVKSNPNLWSVVGDLIFRAAPLPGNLGLDAADRMKAMLAPGVQQIANGGADNPVQMQAKIAQATQIIQQLTEQNTKLNEMLRTKVMDLATREKIAYLNSQTQVIVAQLNAKVADADRNADYDLTALEHHLSTLDAVYQSQLNQQDAAHAASLQPPDQSGAPDQGQGAPPQPAPQGPPPAPQSQLAPGKIVSIRGKKHVIHKVHPDNSFDAVPIPGKQ